MSGLKVHTAWTTSAVATSEQKSFMRVDFNDDDTLIGELIKVAQNNVEEYTGRAITQQTLQLFLDRLPYYRDEKLREGVYTAPDINYSADFIVLPKPPVASITHVKYYANDNTASTFAASNYFSDVDSTSAISLSFSLKEVATETESMTKSTATPLNFFCSSIDIPNFSMVLKSSGSTSSKLWSSFFFFGAA